ERLCESCRLWHLLRCRAKDFLDRHAFPKQSGRESGSRTSSLASRIRSERRAGGTDDGSDSGRSRSMSRRAAPTWRRPGFISRSEAEPATVFGEEAAQSQVVAGLDLPEEGIPSAITVPFSLTGRAAALEAAAWVLPSA